MAKFILPDNSPENKRRMVAASGAYSDPAPVNNNPQIHKSGLAGAKSVSMPITRNAQFAGSGANVAMTQTILYSPS